MRRTALSLLCATVLVVALASCNVPSLTSDTTNVPLTPARQLAGTWSTAIAVPMNYHTDFCGPDQVVATSKWNVTWILTAVEGFTNVLDVEMHYTTSSTTRVPSNCGNGSNGYVPLPAPIFLRMTVSSSAFTAKDTNNGIFVSGSYTTNLMNGTWTHNDCLIYCFGENSPTGEFKMVKQK